jgi:hypothetical protein
MRDGKSQTPLSSKIEQLVAILDLGIVRILHLDPRLTVLAVLGLHNNAFEIEVAHEIVKVRAVVCVINAQKMRVTHWDEVAENLFALHEWQRAQIFAVVPNDIEHCEARLTTTEHQIVELRATVSVQADDFAIQDGRSSQGRSQWMQSCSKRL